VETLRQSQQGLKVNIFLVLYALLEQLRRHQERRREGVGTLLKLSWCPWAGDQGKVAPVSSVMQKMTELMREHEPSTRRKLTARISPIDKDLRSATLGLHCQTCGGRVIKFDVFNRHTQPLHMALNIHSTISQVAHGSPLPPFLS
jgi:hypothetical protein